jgi:ferrochelatase
MTIDALLNLTDGMLKSTPTIQSIEGATVFPSKVEHGDLFISSDPEEIKSALANGAYAIIYDDEHIIPSDQEIAWIQVGSIEDAAFRLLRYVILAKEIEFFLLNEHENSLLKMIILQKGAIVFIAEDWKKAFEQILNSSQKLFVGTDKDLMKQIKPDVKLLKSDINEGYIISDTLFRTTFKVGGYVYQNKELIPFHFDHLLRVVDFCETHNQPYSIDRIRYTKQFIPVFIDGELKTTQSSKSDKVVIFTDNLTDINKAREYIKYQNSWVKSIVLTPPKTKVENLDRPMWFESEDEVRKILKSAHFNYAFVYTLDKSILNNIKKEYSLFAPSDE